MKTQVRAGLDTDHRIVQVAASSAARMGVPIGCGRGFTLLELLLAIGIMMLLMAMAMAGLRYASYPLEARTTSTMLEHGKAMLRETRTALGNGRALPTYLLSRPDWTQRFAALTVYPGNAITFDAVSPAAANSFTRAIIGRLMRDTTNKQTIERLPTNQLMSWRLDDAPFWQDSAYYALGARVKVMAGGQLRYFVCIQSHHTPQHVPPAEGFADYTIPIHPSAPSAPSVPGVPVSQASLSGTYWAEERADYPVMVDAWHHPIIFVPAAGLVARSGIVANASAAPFWASAGSDGEFGSGDDNVYSFDGPPVAGTSSGPPTRH